MKQEKKSKPKIAATKMAGPDHAVHTVVGGDGAYMRTPCKECPWRRANAGSFPPEAFAHSANTAHDMATHTFACHMKGADHASTCAGFLLVGADDNLSVRVRRAKGDWLDVSGDMEELYDSYKEMAVANGVSPDDPALEGCMPEARYERRPPR